MWLSHRGRRPAAVLLVALLLLPTAGCGGEDEPSASERPTSSGSADATPERPAVPDDVVSEFQAADVRQTTAFQAAEVSIRRGRETADLRTAQAGGREARAALYAFDAELREIAFPTEVQPTVNEVIGAVGEAVAAFDEQNQATDEAAFLAADARTGPAVVAFREQLATLRGELGLPEDAPDAAEPTGEAPAYTSPQQPLSPAYVEDGAVTDAAAWRDDLLEVGTQNARAENTYDATRSESFGIVEAWVAGFSLLESTGVVGSAVAAPRSGVSGFTVLPLADKQEPSATNPLVLAFAVKDSSGACAFGVLFGADVPDRGRALDVTGAPCTGDAARAAAAEDGLR